MFRDNNKNNLGTPEIRVRSSRLCTFDSYHKMSSARTTPGLLYSEDGTSGFNYITGRVEAVTDGYLAPFVSAQAPSIVTGGTAA